MKSLPIANPAPASRETVYSYFSRLAATWRTDVADFAHDIGVPFRGLIEQDQNAFDCLANWTNLDCQQMDGLLSWTGVRAGNVRMRFRGEMFVSRALRNPAVRGCPVCLREDALQQDGPSAAAMVMRGDWQLREVTMCVRHSQPLITLWHSDNPRDRYDIRSRLQEIENGILSGGLDSASIQPTSYDRWLDRRLQDGRDDTWLQGQPLFAATTFIRLLGQAFIEIHEPERSQGVGSVHAAGFEIASRGQSAIRHALDQMASAASGHLDEPNKAFGPLYSALSRDYAGEEGLDEFRGLLRECILDHWPVTPGDLLLGKVVTERRLHSVLTAAREIGVGAQVVEHHLHTAGAIQTSDNRPRSRKTFDARTYADLLAEIPTLVGSITMRRAMGATAREFDGLAKEAILVPLTRIPGVKHPWRLSDGVGLVDELQAKAGSVDADNEEWETLLHSRKRSGVSLASLIEAIRDDLLVIAQCEGEDGFHGLVVPKADVDVLANGRARSPKIELPGEMSAAEFGRSIGLRDHRNFTALIEAGHTPAASCIHPTTGRAQYRLSADHIRQFHQRFVTLPTLARETGQHRNTIKSLLARANISRFSQDGRDFGPVYLRSEAADALC